MRLSPVVAVLTLLSPAALAADVVPAPADVLGFEVGERHARHDEIVAYFARLAEASPRVALDTIGRSHEGRPLLLAAISSPENIRDLEALRERHLAAGEDGEAGEGPLVVWQGFSVHGDEASGSNAALVFAHRLATADGDLARILEDTVVLVDPSLNPDGLARFTQWVNGHRGLTPVTDPNHREHHEAWPGGRTNHYWFDLNRDWLPLTQPESRARVAQFQRWRPHVLTDFHEMGSDSTYFFQPGVPERRHPLTPEGNEELTRRIAEYHARALDEAGEPFFTEEVFDDFYYGKGSTYPDVNGSIGILFEQGSTRGRAIDTPHGRRDFRDAIDNQVRTAHSTLRAAHAMRDDLLAWQAAFWSRSLDAAEADRVGGWLVGDGGDPARAAAFLDILLRHHIEIRSLGRDVEVDGLEFRTGHAWVIPAHQKRYRLVKALLERRLTFDSETFYDVSAWTLPDAFDLPAAEVARGRLPDGGATLDAVPQVTGRFEPVAGAVAYAFEWGLASAPRALQRLLAGEFRAYAVTRPTTVTTPAGAVALGRGAVLLPLGAQARRLPAASGTATAERAPQDRRRELEEALAVIARDDGIVVHAVTRGLTPSGPDVGSPSVRRVEPVRPLLVVGRGVSGYEAGEVWHLLDTRGGVPLTMVDRARLDDVDLRDYTHVIMVDGRYGKEASSLATRLRDWVEGGGVLVATKRAAAWASEQGVHLAKDEEDDGAAGDDGADASDDAAGPDDAAEDEVSQADDEPFRPYESFRDDRARRVIGGAILRAEVDPTHPLAFGLDAVVPVFRRGTVVLEPTDNPYATPLRYADESRLAGYVSEERLAELAGTPAVTADRVGRGVVIRMADNPNFRGFWLGTERLFWNALFLGRLVDRTELEPDR